MEQESKEENEKRGISDHSRSTPEVQLALRPGDKAASSVRKTKSLEFRDKKSDWSYDSIVV